MNDTLKMGSRGADVRQLQTMLNALGGNIVVDGIFGDNTFDAVCDFQGAKKLEQDGVVGPLTWTALDQAMAIFRHEEERRVRDRLKYAGEKAVERALAMWKLDIYDPKQSDDSVQAVQSKQYIDDMIRSCGWTWELPYEGDGDLEWCLIFVAACWIDVKFELRKLYFPSTYRFDRYVSYRSAFGEVNDGKGRVAVPVEGMDLRMAIDVRPGDIVLIGKKGYGVHGALVESYNPETGMFDTIEGNARGLGPNGERQQGVVKCRRHISEVRRLGRPSVDDLA